MKRSYAAQWLLTLSLLAAGIGWVLGGDGLFRRAFRPPRSVPEKAREAEAFVAVLFPRIVPNRTPHAMSIGELKAVLGQLSREGFVSIGARDVEDFYLRGRKLPRKAVMLAFSHDDPRVAGLADSALRRYRMRGVYFLSRISKGGRREERRLLTRHHLRRLARSGAWDLGWQQQAAAERAPEMAGSRVLLDADGLSPKPQEPGRFTLRFEGSEQGYNDSRTPRRALRILALRPNLDPRDAARVVSNSFPRRGEFSDDFSKPLDADWIAAWGIVSASPKRLVLVPQPDQTGAGMFLRGTETWRDVIVELELKKYQTEFWIYLRHKDDGSFLRVGARAGWWYVEQKTHAKALPSVLARASMPETLPARVRIVLKDDKALVHVNGRMQFGHAIRLSPKVSSGRVLIGVYNEKPRSALAVLGWVRARPVPERWLALPAALDERRLDELREEAVGSRTFAPSWVRVDDDGTVRVNAGGQESLVRSLAGYYSCRLVPMAVLPLLGSDPARAERMAAGLADAAAALDAQGLNLRLRPEDAASPNAERVLVKLRERLKAGKRRLYVTVDDASNLNAAATEAVDGVLTPSTARGPGFEVLEAAEPNPHGA